MKPIILILLLTSCSPIPTLIHEDQFYITRKYVGHLDTITSGHKVYRVYTDQGCFSVLSKDKPQIIPGTRCYLQAKRSGDYYIWWFDMGKKEYRIYYNYFIN